MRLQEEAARIERAGGALVAVSVDSPEDTKEFEEQLEKDAGPLAFPLLSDPTRAAVRAFGVHERDRDIALPSIFVFDREGKLAWKYVGEAINDRPEEVEVVKAVERVASRGKKNER